MQKEEEFKKFFLFLAFCSGEIVKN